MAKAKAAIKGQSSYTAVAVTVETYHRKGKSKARSSYQPRHSGKKKPCR